MESTAGNKGAEKEHYQRSLFSTDEDAQRKPFSYPTEEEDIHQLLASIVGLAAIQGVGFWTIRRVFDAGFLNKIWDLDPEELESNWSQLPTKHKPDFVKEFAKNRSQFFESGHRFAKELREKGVEILLFGSNDYPSALMDLEDPPRWIFYRGNIGLLHRAAIIAVIGTRKASQDGQKVAYKFSAELVKRNAVVLSGLAKGIDEQAHLGAVDHYGETIAVLGQGIDTTSSQDAEKLVRRIINTDGLIFSEYLPYERPSRDRYLRRNELQAALSKIVIPVESPSMNSGTGATIRRAIRLQRDVLGVTPENTQVKTLLETQKNLQGLGFPVFPVLGKHTESLWRHLEDSVPEHNWAIDPRERQERFLKQFIEQILQAKNRASLDEEAIDRMAELIKKRLKMD